jgi:hypothetical protein
MYTTMIMKHKLTYLSFIIFCLALVFLPRGSSALESASYRIQDEFPNYGSNIQNSPRFALQGDTTWHMQPTASDSYVISPDSMELVVPPTPPSVPSTATNNGGLRDVSIEEKIEQNSSSVIKPTAYSSVRSEQLSSAHSQEQSSSSVRSITNENVKPSAPIYNPLTGMIIDGSIEDENQASSISEEELAMMMAPEIGSNEVIGSEHSGMNPDEMLIKSNGALYRTVISSLNGPKLSGKQFWLSDIALLTLAVIQFLLVFYLAVRMYKLERAERVVLSAILAAKQTSDVKVKKPRKARTSK